ncbi:MAG: hypothetical protein ACOY0T_12050 [Myxococcota bacterium]
MLRAGVEALKGRTEEEWLAYARERWRSGKESSARDGAIEMNDEEFGVPNIAIPALLCAARVSAQEIVD